ncbi:NADPH-dependent curcumin reductase [compost metagenome]
MFPLLNVAARIPVIGLVAHYSDTGPSEGPDRLKGLLGTILVKRIKVQGMIVYDHYSSPHYDDFQHLVAAWLADGSLKYQEEQVEGLENAPSAFIGLLKGKNFGKLVIRVGADD